MVKKCVIAGSIVIVLLVAAVALYAWLGSADPLPPQPIAFNHRLHLERIQGVACKDCHQFVTSQAYAGLPSKFICLDCHDPYPDEDDKEADAFNPKFASLMAFAETEDEIPWHRVTVAHPDVFFSHRRHVTAGGLDCLECHPNIPDRTSPLDRGPVEMRMETCIGCHEEKNASVDCLACHW